MQADKRMPSEHSSLRFISPALGKPPQSEAQVLGAMA